MKITTLTLACLLASATVMAIERPEKEMRAIARTHLATQATARGGENAVGSVATIQLLRSADSYSVYGSSDSEGFVIVSRDDQFPQVLGYSASAFDEAQMPPALQWWLQAIDRSLALRKATGQLNETTAFTATPNFVTTTWGQEAPYNNLCPKMPLKNALTGCVATAMAQVLRYYKYPSSSTGNSYYTLSTEPTVGIGKTLSSTFEWDLMLDAYTRTGGTAEERNAVATLMRDCGYAAKMCYDLAASNSHYIDAANGFVDNMRFEKGGVRFAEREYYSDAEWTSIIYTELQNKRPILYSGVDPTSGGHAFLLSGVDEQGLVYVNWGWNGIADGFYDLADMAPAGIQGNDANHVDHFNQGVNMLYQLAPSATDLGLLKPMSQFVVYNGDYALNRYQTTSYLLVSVTGDNTFILNDHYLPFSGSIYLTLVNKETHSVYTYAMLVTGKDDVADILEPGMGMSFTNYANLDKLPNGTYSAYLTSRSKEENNLVPVRSAGGVKTYTLVRSSGGFTVKSDNVSAVSTPHFDHEAAAVARYSLGGQRLPQARKGLNIVRRADGSVVKELVK